MRLKNEALKRKQQEEEMRLKQEEAQQNMEMRKIELNKKRKIINEMVKIKGNWIVTISGKKIEQLNEEDLEKLSEKFLKDEKSRLEIKVRENMQNKEQKEFAKQDYLNRAIRVQEIAAIQASWEQEEESVETIVQRA